MPNILLALQIGGQLLQQLLSINSQISAASTAGVDLTAAQVAAIQSSAAAAIAQLNTDIAADGGAAPAAPAAQ